MKYVYPQLKCISVFERNKPYSFWVLFCDIYTQCVNNFRAIYIVHILLTE